MDGLVPAKIRLVIGIILALLLCSTLTACGGGGGENSEGAEGRHEAGGDGNGGGNGDGGDDGDGGDGDGDSEVPFASDGVSRGVFETIPLAADESFAGLLDGMEIAVRFDAAAEKFIGRLRNEAETAVCDVRVTMELNGAETLSESSTGSTFPLPGLRRFGRADFEFAAPGASFSEWTAIVETFGCATAPTGTSGGEGSGGEGAEGEHGEGEGGSEGGGEGSEGGHEGGEGDGEGDGEGGGDGDESSPDTPLTERLSGTFQNQIFDFAFDAATGAFRGTVENPTSSTICQSRTEIHLGAGAQVIELGPTIPVDLAPGEIIKVVMSAEGYALDTYSLHPESSPCQ